MRAELQEKLEEYFSFMKRKQVDEDERITNIYNRFGIEAGDGWYQLIYDLCKEISDVLSKADQPVVLIIDQIKEKFGKLRFYYHFDGDKNGIQAFDFIGVGNLRITPQGDGIKDEISKIVRKYEDKSSYVCECCGSEEGRLRTDLGWIRVLCYDCYSKVSERGKRK